MTDDRHLEGLLRAQDGDAGCAAICGMDVEACIPQDSLEREPHRGLIIDHQYAALHQT